MTDRPDPTEVALQLWRQRFPKAEALFVGGSVIRGEGTEHSDLDIVVLLKSVEHAWREATVVDGWPVELFIHDLDTLAYFVEQDCQARRPCLPSMLTDAVVVPKPSKLTEHLQNWAGDIILNPPAMTAKALDDERYFLSDLVDDLKDPRPRAELIAIAAKLYDQLGSFILSKNGRWSGAGKHLPRRLRELDPILSAEFDRVFNAVFVESDPAPLLAFAEEVLQSQGGPLFDGYRSDAPATARSRAPDFEP